jgi:N-acetylmuramoyl-L-alanine amidase
VLEITLATHGGHRASVSTQFVVSNATTGPGRINFDSPGATANPYLGQALFSGWALNDNTAVSSLSVTIDGVPYGTATYGLPRADVCGVYPGRAGCPNVGWTFGLNTTLIADGTHTLAVTENNADGTFYTSSTPFVVANYSVSDPMRIFIESPTTAYGIYGVIDISGWALDDDSQISSVKIAIDGVPVGTATYGLSRPDVCLAYPGRLGCPNVGWYFFYDTSLVPNGTHILSVTGITTLGQSSTNTEVFTIAN